MSQDTKKFIGILLVVFYLGSAVGTPVLGLILAALVTLVWLNGRMIRDPKYSLELSMELQERARKNEDAVLTLSARYTSRIPRVTVKTEVSVVNLLTGENMRIPVSFHVQGPVHTKYRLKVSDQRCGKIEVSLHSCTLCGLRFQGSRTLQPELRKSMIIEPDVSAAALPEGSGRMAGRKVLVLLDNAAGSQVSLLPDRKSQVTEKFFGAAAALRKIGAEVSLSWYDPAQQAFTLQEIRSEEDWNDAVDRVLGTGFAETDSASIFSLTARASGQGFDQFYAAEAAPRADLDDLRRLGPVEVL